MYRTLLEEFLLLEKIQKYETELWTVLCVLFFNSALLGGNFGTAGKGAAAARQAAGDTPTSRLNTRHK